MKNNFKGSDRNQVATNRRVRTNSDTKVIALDDNNSESRQT